MPVREGDMGEIWSAEVFRETFKNNNDNKDSKSSPARGNKHIKKFLILNNTAQTLSRHLKI